VAERGEESDIEPEPEEAGSMWVEVEVSISSWNDKGWGHLCLLN
jgi:hypothetical protein